MDDGHNNFSLHQDDMPQSSTGANATNTSVPPYPKIWDPIFTQQTLANDGCTSWPPLRRADTEPIPESQSAPPQVLHRRNTAPAGLGGSIAGGVVRRGKCWMCTECSTMFSLPNNAYRHRKSAHGIHERPSCTECGEHFTRNDNLKRHRESRCKPQAKNAPI